MKQTVLIVHNFYKIPGGEDTVVQNEKRLLEENGHKVYLYTRSNRELNTLSAIGKICFLFGTVFNIKTYRDIKRIIREQKIDVVHVHNTLSFISASVYYAAVKCKVPVVQTVHNFRMECMGATFYREGHVCEDCLKYGNKEALKHACYRNSKLQTAICLFANWVHRRTKIYQKINYICLTEFNKEKLLQWTDKGKAVLNPSQIYVKPNFTYELCQNDNIINQTGDYYLFIGRIESIKGISVIIDAFKNMPDRKIKLAGTGTELEAYKEQVKDFPNIEFLGYQERENLARLLSGAKAVIVASQWYETFGMIIAEAYSCGIPVIAGDIGNIGNLVVEGTTGLKFRYDDSKDLARAIEDYEQMDFQWLSNNARKYYLQNFSSECNYATLKEIYDAVM